MATDSHGVKLKMINEELKIIIVRQKLMFPSLHYCSANGFRAKSHCFKIGGSTPSFFYVSKAKKALCVFLHALYVSFMNANSST